MPGRCSAQRVREGESDMARIRTTLPPLLVFIVLAATPLHAQGPAGVLPPPAGFSPAAPAAALPTIPGAPVAAPPAPAGVVPGSPLAYALADVKVGPLPPPQEPPPGVPGP